MDFLNLASPPLFLSTRISTKSRLFPLTASPGAPASLLSTFPVFPLMHGAKLAIIRPPPLKKRRKQIPFSIKIPSAARFPLNYDSPRNCLPRNLMFAIRPSPEARQNPNFPALFSFCRPVFGLVPPPSFRSRIFPGCNPAPRAMKPSCLFSSLVK